MSEINLLPQELKPKGYAIKLSKTFKKIASVGLAVFFITFVLIIAANVILSIRTNNLKKSEEALRSEIYALEQTEQKLVLVRDRLGKISQIKAAGDASEEAEIIGSIISVNPGNINIEDVIVKKDKAELKVSTDQSVNLTRFFSALRDLGFSKIDLLAFDYSSSLGYSVEVSIEK